VQKSWLGAGHELDVFAAKKPHEYVIMNQAITHIEGIVGEDISAASVRAFLEANDGQPVMLHLNSPGGLATEGMSIFNALKGYAGRVTVVIDALAASAASLIAMAGDEIVMRAGSLMMSTILPPSQSDRQKRTGRPPMCWTRWATSSPRSMPPGAARPPRRYAS
jgi:membrane-bound ClpP family serine protease